MVEYFQTALKFSDLFKAKELAKCRDVGESISQHIHLIITSRHGEYRFDPLFGCSIWDHDFENVFANADWNERVSESLKSAIEKYEPRIKNIFVKAEISQEEIPSGAANSLLRIKQKVMVKVEATLTATNERFETTQYLYISPLSYD